MATFGSELLAAALAGTEPGEHPLRHVAELPARHGRPQAWPTWVEPDVIRAFTERGSVRRGHTSSRPRNWRTPGIMS